ncbi:4-(cytidine 5'-diphospho)-2-C-methyl-D-erythritol kinase [Ancylobacter sp. MQZ15Z-1]|uniref:4-diphosphocytidyl-2-C-methyl-D-erythritol kinase n=1 Tax=Ancylobacter mangrovi TaxID=2972472 RepID=A0A9X2PDT3_9HYPH|nr:4-(cytidine 5'-diphospho)-2-C-methyl-D-erythritol kinase [Ancylobacter mangrovi]MCS0495046.1 4-(cytidine 5'-diphospho)-2-C-methyl-D-erythritol kinase [Ancylobacter mangrovi]
MSGPAQSRLPPPPAAAGLRERAPAKVNLTLRVVGRRADGYHELASVVGFAGTGDRLELEPGPELALVLRGPGGAALAGEGDNLVLRAARELAARVPGLTAGRFVLDKRLPVAAGIGGGSADAAAALRLLARANVLAPDDPRLAAAALATGSDVPVCLAGVGALMAGRGERVTPLALPRFGMVLVNPRVPVATGAVFAALGLAPGAHRPAPAVPAAFAGRDEALAFLRGEPNDLEEPARRLAPVLAEVEAALQASEEVRLVRMSGSGATMFALYDDCRAAARAARRVAAGRPGWWVKSTVLG